MDEEKAKKLLDFLVNLEIESDQYKRYSEVMTDKEKDQELEEFFKELDFEEEVITTFKTRDLNTISKFLNEYLKGTGEGAVAILIVIFVAPS